MHFTRLAILALTGAFLVFASGPAAAADKTDTTARQVVATLHQFVDGFNKGDTKMELATCAAKASIVDDFPPHAWQGPTACADWARGLAAANAAQGISEGNVTLGAPTHVAVDGNSAYVVAPASYTYKRHGTRVVESGSILTVALVKVEGAWRISGWAWTVH